MHDTFAPYKPNNPPATSPRRNECEAHVAESVEIFIRLSKAEVGVLTHEARQEYMARLFDAAQRQINVNRLLLERQKRYLEHSRQKILARHAKRMGGQQPPRGAAPFPSRATHLYDV